jgi:hypothetical protein
MTSLVVHALMRRPRLVIFMKTRQGQMRPSGVRKCRAARQFLAIKHRQVVTRDSSLSPSSSNIEQVRGSGIYHSGPNLGPGAPRDQARD